MTVQQLLDLAIEQHRAGHMREASQSYQDILRSVPAHPDALHLLGLIEYESGSAATGIERVRAALRARPRFVEALGNLGLMLCATGHVDEGIEAYRQAIALAPDHAEAHYNLALTLHERRQLDQAIDGYRRAISYRPDYREAHHYLGLALSAKGDYPAAIESLRRALALDPGDFDAQFNLAFALKQVGRLNEAIQAYRRAAEMAPGNADVWNNLGAAQRAAGARDDAIAAFRRATQISPKFAQAHYNLAHCLNEHDQPESAIAAYHRALALDPNLPDWPRNLGSALRNYGKVEEAIETYRRGMQAFPHDARIHSDLLLTLYCQPELDGPAILAEHRRFNELHAKPLSAAIERPSVRPLGNRRLRIGYVSCDFRDHVSNRFLVPLFSSHDCAQFEIFCYASVSKPDQVTRTFQSYVEHWRDISAMTDDEATQAIRTDAIDILVDLGMHTADNRLLIFARRPAPVQAAYLAYSGGTTGLSTVDFRLTDRYLDPPGSSLECYSEQSIHLPETYWCSAALVNTPPISARPADARQAVTFGSLSAMCKQNRPMLRLWMDLLRQVQNSTLLLHVHPGTARQDVLNLAAEHDVSPQRIRFHSRRTMHEYLRAYDQIDIVLDTYPYAGGTTTFDALWMGVSVVTLAGRHALSWSGLSILSNLGMSEYVASSREQYVQIARDLAADSVRRAQMRAGLRQRLIESRLMDSPQFARDVEGAYRQMWARKFDQ
jgi:predicted O-linked N-acetylglucosamine transferase (SPINDLY family)